MEAYRRFVAEEMAMGRSPELTGGRLIRSKGGWSQVLSARRSGEREESDERILGSGDFVTAVLKEAEEKTRRLLKIRRAGSNLRKIIEEECKKKNISPNEVKGGNRGTKASELRATTSQRGLTELGLSMAEMARQLGVSTSAIAEAIARLKEDGWQGMGTGHKEI